MQLTQAFNTIDKQRMTKFQLLVLELRADFLFDSVRSIFQVGLIENKS